MMFQYLHTDVADDVSISTYRCWQNMIQYSHTDAIEDDLENDRR